jgi:hypothetical protein
LSRGTGVASRPRGHMELAEAGRLLPFRTSSLGSSLGNCDNVQRLPKEYASCKESHKSLCGVSFSFMNGEVSFPFFYLPQCSPHRPFILRIDPTFLPLVIHGRLVDLALSKTSHDAQVNKSPSIHMDLSAIRSRRNLIIRKGII